MARTKTYGHYCAAARALEMVGEKWALLAVRDLLQGPARFSDLLRSLGGITPKLLTVRLRDLEAAGVVERDEEEGRREVWYRLTPAGEELRPVIEALLVWGLDHAAAPAPGERVDPQRAARSAATLLNHRRVRPSQPTVWSLRFGEDPGTSLRFDGERWSVVRGEQESPADLTIGTTPDVWVAMIRAQGTQRAAELARMHLVGEPARIAEFRRLLLAAVR
ncbi:MAG TPA: helix-turn-helix domain-containing protein [Thermomicrobiales bacterium]|jgi:DNA-binding HxlR family transcriptional regulator